VGVFDAGVITLGYHPFSILQVVRAWHKKFFSFQWSNQSWRKFSCCAC